MWKWLKFSTLPENRYEPAAQWNCPCPRLFQGLLRGGEIRRRFSLIRRYNPPTLGVEGGYKNESQKLYKNFRGRRPGAARLSLHPCRSCAALPHRPDRDRLVGHEYPAHRDGSRRM